MNKPQYVLPTITRHLAGQMNAQAHGHTTDACPNIDGVAVEELVAAHGSPLFVFSERTLRNTYRTAHQAFASRYPNVQFAWSYKTNYLRAICAVFHSEGSIAEVVSDFEYEKARRGGIAGKDIIFNGPYKTAPALQRAIEEGAKIQIDNLDELDLIDRLADQWGKPVSVAIRIHCDTGIGQVWTKFGFDADGMAAVQAIKRIHGTKYLKLVGLHTHIGTYILKPEAYTRAANKLLDLAELARREYQFEIHYLNMGGGFASRSQLHGHYLPAETEVPTFDEYAEAITKPIRERWPKGSPLPKLYLETGRALVDEAGSLITTIVAMKNGATAHAPLPENRDKSGHRSTARAPSSDGYLVDAGINLLYTATWYQMKVRPARAVRGPMSDRTLYGCLCMNIDVIRNSVALPNLSVGDHLVVHPVGAYNLTQSMQFITYRPRVVMIGENGQVDVIREKENLYYVEGLDRMPARLAKSNVE